MAITTADQLVNALATKQQILGFMCEVTTTPGGRWYSTWIAPGYPAASSIPATGSGTAYTKASAGALQFANAAAGEKTYLARMAWGGNVVSHLALADRLVATSGLSGTVTIAQTVNTVALPTRASSGVGVEIFAEVYASYGATASNITCAYTNSAGVSGRVTPGVTLNAAVAQKAGYMTPLPLMGGDVGVQSVQSVTLSASTGTAGNFGVTMARRIVDTSTPTTGQLADFGVLDGGLPIVPDDACLTFISIPGGNFPRILGTLMLVQG